MEVVVCEIGSDLEEEFIGKVVERHGSRVVLDMRICCFEDGEEDAEGSHV
jgi:hypothetical protein